MTAAFGKPGVAPTWSSSDKDIVLTALGPSRLWVTLGHGILNEVYYPSTGQPQIRDLGFIVACGGRWFELKRVNRYQLSLPEPYVLQPTVVHAGEGYRLTLELLVDPEREVVLLRYRLEGRDARLYALLAPHLGPDASDNSAWLDGEALCAQGGSEHLCLLARPGFSRASAGFVGASDGWQDFAKNGAMTWAFDRAEGGNVALMGELAAAEGVLALGLAHSAAGAETRARSSLAEGFEALEASFRAAWRSWGAALEVPAVPAALRRETLLSAAVLKAHEDKGYPGAVVASLSVPWGNTRDDLGGYHLVWARDAVETGLALLASGQRQDARRMLAYLAATQRPDGHWAQNFYPDGTPYWRGIQLDEVAFPILLAAKLRELGELDAVEGVGEMVRRAAGYLARHGPLSPQDRWEENAGLSPFTLAAEVAALAAAADFLPGGEASYARSLADDWNDRIEAWTFASGTELASRFGVPGYYVRLAPSAAPQGLRGRVEVRNRAGEVLAASALVGLEFLYLARLGLRRADDPRITASLAVAEALLGVDTPCGRAYHRYNGDGYGEHADGRAFDGTGVGRAWPLLTGERGHYALQCGDDPLPYLEAMACMTGSGGLIPEQVWDGDPIPERNLYPGKPTGSAMPLVWAHAEFLKLVWARDHGRPLELLESVRQRYGGVRRRPEVRHWRASAPAASLAGETALLVEGDEPFRLHYGFDDWQRVAEADSAPLGLGMHGVRLEPAQLTGAHQLVFTRYLLGAARWEGEDHRVALEPADG